MMQKLQPLHSTLAYQSIRALFVFVFCVTFLCGCLEDGRVSWTSDGKQLAVCAADGLRLADSHGSLGKPQLKYPLFIDWIPSSNKLLVVTADDGMTWNEMQAVLPNAEKEEILSVAQTLKSELLAANGDFERCMKRLSEKHINGDYAREAILALQATSDAELAAALGKQWKSLEKIPGKVSSVQSFTVENGALGSADVLYRTSKDIETVRSDWTGDHLAIVDQAATRRLLVTDKQGSTVIARRVGEFPDFSADGKVLWFARSASTKDETDGRLCRVDLKGGKSATVEDVTELRFDERARVRCLPDGGVLFSNIEKGKDNKKRAELLMQWKAGAKEATVVARRKRGDSAAMCVFELSPDKKQVLVPGPAGALDVLQLATGKVTAVTNGDKSGYSSFAPCWKGNEQVCFTIAADQKDSKVERRVAYWSACDGKIRSLSETWPEPAIAGLLTSNNKTAVSDLKTLVSEFYKMAPGDESN